ncbi:MAG: pyridoxal phosphate-dependent aminotransferase [Rhodobacter sp.]|uniref:pyridoxal phosphate-dependent aminotransferase n=1 Tax=Pararhodobacter sp. TaxID=2127056 RepID=UPI001E07CC23|nr:pyridoxal phosphate-dependent aminotransferase [Pararhodobacter sp.]MCB1344964.1 pyridoxal phosphate-dependent aminotransferase [Paracoccaceae bacterium]MCC0073448.1 pyridoxal phosphate-dependent aminotransferase [Rhodobacter sp.]HPD91439.1 pyridoxal phosphate-dependent aminotransferase [Pararhodobacter sp.]
MTGPRYTRLVQSLPATVPFVGPETQERARGAGFEARLGANENGFGPSPRAIAAMAEAAAGQWMYGDPENHDLKREIAARMGVTPAHVMVGEGIDGLLGYLVRLLIEVGDPVVTSDGAYPTFNFHVAGYGGTLVKVPYLGDSEDPSALIHKAREVGAKIVYLANPDNPMGSWHPASVIEAMIAQVPEGTLLALDEAYVEFAPEGTAARIDPDDPRVIRFRTFSKAYGMAGARVAYAIAAPALIAAFDKVRNHFGMNRAAQIGALAALRDTQHLDQTRQAVAVARARLADIAAENGLRALPSATNFVTIDCGGDGDFARRVLAAVVRRGVFIRMPFVAPHDRCIRVSTGPDAQIDAFARALPEALAEARTGAPA